MRVRADEIEVGDLYLIKQVGRSGMQSRPVKEIVVRQEKNGQRRFSFIVDDFRLGYVAAHSRHTVKKAVR